MSDKCHKFIYPNEDIEDKANALIAALNAQNKETKIKTISVIGFGEEMGKVTMYRHSLLKLPIVVEALIVMEAYKETMGAILNA